MPLLPSKKTARGLASKIKHRQSSQTPSSNSEEVPQEDPALIEKKVSGELAKLKTAPLVDTHPSQRPKEAEKEKNQYKAQPKELPSQAKQPIKISQKNDWLKLINLQVSIVVQKIIDLSTTLIPSKKEKFKGTKERQNESLSTEQREVWENCLTAIKDNEYEKLERHLSHGSKKDRRILREKLLTDFNSYPYVIEGIRSHLAEPEN